MLPVLEELHAHATTLRTRRGTSFLQGEAHFQTQSMLILMVLLVSLWESNLNT